jgi:PAS domain S-box-containing protein
MGPQDWSTLFWAAFRDSRNAMALVDEQRRIVDVNGAYLGLFGHERGELIGSPIYRLVEGGPRLTPAEWAEALGRKRFAGDASMIRSDGERIVVQWGATVEEVTGQRLVLVVALSVSRRQTDRRPALVRPPVDRAGLSDREREIVRLVALGRTGPEIADELQISHHTVRTHVRNSMVRLGARSRAHLVAQVLGQGHALGD